MSNVICYDTHLLKKSGVYKQHSVFESSINYVNHSNDLLVITTKNGITNSLQLDEDSFNKYKQKLELVLDENLLKNTKAISYKFDVSLVPITDFENTIDSTLKELAKDSISLYKADKNMLLTSLNKIISTAYENLDLKKFVEKVVSLHSGGIGSTPSVDDAILGMAIVAKRYGDDISLFRQTDYQKTTLISRVMLCDFIYEDRLSLNVQALFCNKHSAKKPSYELVKNIGSSSGLDMLCGAWWYINKRRNKCIKN